MAVVRNCPGMVILFPYQSFTHGHKKIQTRETGVDLFYGSYSQFQGWEKWVPGTSRFRQREAMIPVAG